MKKIILLVILFIQYCQFVPPAEKTITEVWQSGKLIDKICGYERIWNTSYSIGGTYYKITNEKCQ